MASPAAWNCVWLRVKYSFRCSCRTVPVNLCVCLYVGLAIYIYVRSEEFMMVQSLCVFELWFFTLCVFNLAPKHSKCPQSQFVWQASRDCEISCNLLRDEWSILPKARQKKERQTNLITYLCLNFELNKRRSQLFTQ